MDKCTICGKEATLECENCELEHCRKCYRSHYCGVLCDSRGYLVRCGQVLSYPFNPKYTYKVVNIPGTFVKGGFCYGTRIKPPSEEWKLIQPRLMEVI